MSNYNIEALLKDTTAAIQEDTKEVQSGTVVTPPPDLVKPSNANGSTIVDRTGTPVREMEQIAAEPEPVTYITIEGQVVPADTVLEKIKDSIAPAYLMGQHTKVCIYGPPGAGKTKWACDGPGVLLYAVEVGQQTLLNYASMRKLPVLKFKSVFQAMSLAELLRQGYMPEYETIVIDTFSELQHVALDDRVDSKFMTDSARERYTPEGKDYQSNSNHMRRIAQKFRDVDRNVIFVCHQKTTTNERTGIQSWAPDLTDKVFESLNFYTSVVVRSTPELGEGDKPVFKQQYRGTIDVIAKTRINNMSTYMTNSTFNDIHKMNQEMIRQAQEENQ